jgi:mono/diheme cytochrome c family protein
MLLGLSGPEAVGIGIGFALLVGWAIFVAVNAGRPSRPPGSEVEDAPNRRVYLSDDELETHKLDKALTWGLLSLAFVAVALPVYWLREPGRQEGATDGFDKKAVNRGAELFQSAQAELEPGHISAGCADCHGNRGQGGVVPFVMPDPFDEENVIPVNWTAPSLDDVLLRYNEDEVREILVYGRPPTPMPAWGVAGGGALGEQQINDLIAFLESIQISPEKARAKAEDLSGGEELFNAYCARCHTLGWSYRDDYEEPNAQPGGGAFGPSLRDGRTVEQFPDEEEHLAFITEGSDFGKNFGRRGIGSGRMPGFGQLLTEEQIQAIVEYERSL